MTFILVKYKGIWSNSKMADTVIYFEPPDVVQEGLVNIHKFGVNAEYFRNGIVVAIEQDELCYSL